MIETFADTEERQGGETAALPESWASVPLREIAHVNRRDTAIRELPDDLPITFVPMASVEAESGTIASPLERRLADVRKGFTPFGEEDVLFAKITPCMENGKAAIAKGLLNGRGFGSTEFHVLTPKAGVLPEWLFYFVRQQSFREEAKANFSGTAGQLRVPSRFLEDYPFPLAPTTEQRRVVAKIEELFTDLDAGVASLKRVQANLQRYKAAVLKAACEGKLVPQDPSDEPASQLLEHILAERRARWEEGQRAKGKDPRKVKYDEPAPPDTEGLPELPERWVWAKLDQVMDLTAGVAFKESEYSSQGVRLLQIANVSFGKIIWEQLKYLPVDYLAKYPNLRLKEGDILMALNRPILGDALKIGALKDADTPAILYQRVGRFDVYFAALRAYVLYFAQSPLFVSRLKSKLQGVDQPFVTKPSLMNIPLPLPPINEQYRIVSELERRLSVIHQLDATAEANMKRAERLRQAILSQAFVGKLVPQDPSDEPASVLLERIRAEQELPAQSASRPANGREKRQTATNDTQEREADYIQVALPLDNC